MRSRSSFRGHPIHPALIPFPLGFLVGAFLFDAAGFVGARGSWWTTGGHLAAAGVVAGLIAAVPGFIDYLYTVPPKSTGKKRATRHMIVNLSALVLVGGAWLLRPPEPGDGALLTLGLEAVAVALLGAGGWMGGTLVNRNQIGVDHRYANAGKWSEARVAGGSAQPLVVARSDELEVNQMKLVRVNGRRIVLARSEKGYAAFDDRCTHRGGPLADGVMICGTVQCPWHGSQFDTATGEVRSAPAKDPIATYRVLEEHGEVRLLVPDSRDNTLPEP